MSLVHPVFNPSYITHLSSCNLQLEEEIEYFELTKCDNPRKYAASFLYSVHYHFVIKLDKHLPLDVINSKNYS